MDEAFRSELRQLVEVAMARHHVPGVAVGIVEGDEELIEAFGVTNISSPTAVDERTLFQIGSTTKTFTAMLLMQEVEAGRLDLDAPVRHYLPEFRLQRDEWSDLVLVRHLLTHSGGFDGDWFLRYPRHDEERLAAVVEAMDQVPVRSQPGEAFSYSNLGFAVAGRIGEVLGGGAYEDLIEQRLLRPLGMSNSTVHTHEALSRPYASGHLVRGERVELAHPWHLVRSAAAHGGVISDLLDQLRWARFQLGDGTGVDAAGVRTQVLSGETLRTMHEPQLRAGSICDAVGYAWLIEEIDGMLTLRHGGETNGQMSAFRLIPERDFAITVLTNASSGIQLHEELVDWVMDRRLGIRRVAPEVVEPSDASAVVGRYEGTLRDVELLLNDGAVWIDIEPHQREGRPTPIKPEPSPVRFIAPRTIEALDGSLAGMRGELFDGVDGVEMWLRWDGRLMPRRSENG
jgi:CubicO group peptidase (beta-lactamase class C family)